MDLAQFGPNATGRLVPTIHGASAFVPNPLPPELDRGALFDPYGKAMALMGKLDAKISQVPNPELIVRPLQRREALTSSALEGTYTTSDELALLEAGETRFAKPETLEVRNYHAALAEAVAALTTLPISHRLIRQAHFALLSGLPNPRGGNKRPGEYKSDQNWIGGSTIQRARFIPPPPAETQTAMDDLEKYVNRENPEQIPALIDAALVHYQFETIHPFGDGNGRVGRMLIPLILLTRGSLTVPAFYPSAAFERRKDEYIDRMFAVSAIGDWTGWIEFFLSICSETCTSTIEIVDRLIDLNQIYKERAIARTRSNHPLILIDELFSNPVISTPIAKGKLDVTSRAARMTIGILEEIGAVKKIKGFSSPEYFVAAEVLVTTS